MENLKSWEHTNLRIYMDFRNRRIRDLGKSTTLTRNLRSRQFENLEMLGFGRLEIEGTYEMEDLEG